MDSHEITMLVVKIFAVLLLVALNGFFVATEFALVKVRVTQLEPMIAKGNRRAGMARHIIGNLDAYLSACQLGITLASLGLGWIGEPIFEGLLKPVFGALDMAGAEHDTIRKTIAFVVGFATITFLHIVVGEQAPKSFGIRQPLSTVLWVAYPVRGFYFIAFPFTWLLNESSLAVLRMIGMQPAHEHEGAASEEELSVLVASAQKHFGASRFSRDIVQNALDLRLRVARDVMRPRKEITALDTKARIEECLEIAEKSRYSRFPLCEDGDLNQTLGVIHIKDLFAHRHTARVGAELSAAMRKIIYVPDTARLEKLLQFFLERKLHLAIVVDEYGGTVGLVTFENIMEELVGQIQDEFDQEKPLLTRSSETTWEVSGALPLHQLEEFVGASLKADGVTTTSGWVTHNLGGFPKTGDVVSVGIWVLRVEEMEGTRVSRMRVTRKPATDMSAQLRCRDE